jgi:hypothetical protein
MKSAFFTLPHTRANRGKETGPRDGFGKYRGPRSYVPG